MTGYRTALAVSTLVICSLSGCDRGAPPAPAVPASAPTPPPTPTPAPAPAGATAQASGAAAPRRAPVLTASERDFQIALREVTYEGRFPLGATNTSEHQPQRGGATLSMQLSMALTDTMVSRIYRTRQGLTLTSVVENNGRELVGAEQVNARTRSSGMRGEFPTSGDGRMGGSPQGFLIPLPLTEVPQSLEKIAGYIEIELVSEETDRVVAIGAPEEMIEVGPGMKAVLKLLATDPESNAVSRASVEIRSEAGAGGGVGAVVQSVELIDTSGSTVATLNKREESTVGNVTRRRYSYETYSPGGRPERMGTGKPVKSMRIRAYTGIETIKLPFEFGPVDLTLPRP